MPLYHIQDRKTVFLKPTNFASERVLQRLIEDNLPILLSARFVASEFVINIDGVQKGRIDTLCLDNENTPVIIEYKKTENDSVINQGLFYLEWLMTHKGDFTVEAQKKLGKDVVIDWDNPRVIVVAERFSVYDVYGVRRMGANVELWTYRYFNNDMLLLEAMYTPGGSVRPVKDKKPIEEREVETITPPDVTPPIIPAPKYDLKYHITGRSELIKEVFDALRERILGLSTDESEIVEVFRKMYIGYRHGKSFCEVHLYKNDIVIWLDIPFNDLKDPAKIAKDVSQIGHWGNGEVEVRLSKMEDIDTVFDLIQQSYDYSS